jgi:hypothetical protein
MGRPKKIIAREYHLFDQKPEVSYGIQLEETDGFTDDVRIGNWFGSSPEDTRQKVRKEFEAKRDFANYILSELDRLGI